MCLDASSLPYHPGVVEEIRSARAAGRRTVLATAADPSIAQAVAEELDLFDGILSDLQIDFEERLRVWIRESRKNVIFMRPLTRVKR